MNIGQKVKVTNEIEWGLTGIITNIFKIPFSSPETLTPGVDMKEPDSEIIVYEVEFDDGTRKQYSEDYLETIDE